LNRPNNIRQTVDRDFTEDIPLCVCALKTNRCSSVKHNHDFYE